MTEETRNSHAYSDEFRKTIKRFDKQKSKHFLEVLRDIQDSRPETENKQFNFELLNGRVSVWSRNDLFKLYLKEAKANPGLLEDFIKSNKAVKLGNKLALSKKKSLDSANMLI